MSNTNSRVVLCRRDSAEIGHPPKFCCKPITDFKNNALEWCRECRKNLPFWPVEQVVPVPQRELSEVQ